MALKDTKVLNTSDDVDLPEIEIPKKAKIVVTHGESIAKVSKDIDVILAGHDKEVIFDPEKKTFEKPKPKKAMTSHEMHEGAYGEIKDVLKPKRMEDVVIDLDDPVIPEHIEIGEPPPEANHPTIEDVPEEKPELEWIGEGQEPKPKAKKPKPKKESKPKVEKPKKDSKKKPAKKTTPEKKRSTKKEEVDPAEVFDKKKE